MNRTIARLSALLVTGSCVNAGCGGKVVFDGNADGVSTSGSSSSSSGGGAGSGGSTGAGGCDPASHTIDYKNYDLSCTMPSDCIPAFLGNLCGNCTCALATINVADKAKLEAESQAKAVPTSPGGCFCPANAPTCLQGQCVPQVPGP